MNLVLVYPNQLFEENELLKEIDKTKDAVLLIEDYLFFGQYNFHKLKIEFHKKTMSFYKKFLEEKGYKVILCSDIEEGVKSFAKIKNVVINSSKIETLYVYDVVDNYLEKKIRKYCNVHDIQLKIKDSPMFLTTNAQIDLYLSTQKSHKSSYLMKNFYEWQRRRLCILIDKNGIPVGGRWSFDEDNRKKIPKGLKTPDETVSDFSYAVSFEDVKKCLKTFLEERLSNFGEYEDAVVESKNILFHSVLTPYLNSGLLTPIYVVDSVLMFAEKNDIPLNSLEGFIRQIIGWREYVRMVYIKLGSAIRTKNYFQAKRKIPESFWTGKTGILPVDNTIDKLNSTAYTHHIPRLMIMGNFMNLCGFDPDEVYKWFMEMYIDSYDWVMVPNVYSMALYADGGMITTKPYISGSSYVLRMSDYKKSKESDDNSWNKIWDALFWSFVGKHYEKLKKEGRLGFIGVQYSKMSEVDRNKYDKLSASFFKNL